jgi:hypothetical protein
MSPEVTIRVHRYSHGFNYRWAEFVKPNSFWIRASPGRCYRGRRQFENRVLTQRCSHDTLTAQERLDVAQVGSALV